MAAPPEFARRLTIRATNVRQNGAQAVRTVGLACLAAVVPRTPVDTGRARSNWLMGLNSPRRETIGYPDIGAGDAIDRDGNVALVEGRSVIAAVRPRDALWLSNNLPYIRELNAGSSTQAAAGYVQNAVLAGIRSLTGFRLLGS